MSLFKSMDSCNRSHVIFGGEELKNEHSSPLGNVGDRWLVVTRKQRQPKSLLASKYNSNSHEKKYFSISMYAST